MRINCRIISTDIFFSFLFSLFSLSLEQPDHSNHKNIIRAIRSLHHFRWWCLIFTPKGVRACSGMMTWTRGGPRPDLNTDNQMTPNGAVVVALISLCQCCHTRRVTPKKNRYFAPVHFHAVVVMPMLIMLMVTLLSARARAKGSG